MRTLSALLATSFVLVTPAAAEPRLIATLDIAATGHDKASQTAGQLENGIAGDSLGGLGSGLAYAGGDTFLALPDRGPNAKAYNTAVDNTSSYINRFHTYSFRLKAEKKGLPFVITARHDQTTLLWSPTSLIYGDGKAAGLGSSAPAVNSAGHFYFDGRSDGFDPSRGSGNPDNARFDSESLRVSADGKSVYVSDEYGPDVYQFDRTTGQRLKAFALPAKFYVQHPGAKGDDEISGNSSGRVANKGMEGLALTPDGKTLVGIMQSPLIQDGGTKAACVRIVTIDIATGATHEYAYGLDKVGSPDKPKYAGISEITAVNTHQFLVDERDSKGRGEGGDAVFKRLFLIDLDGAQDVSAMEGEAALAKEAVGKTLFLDMVAVMKAGGIKADAIPEKIEGVTFGPDVKLKGKTLHTLWIANDNDFVSVDDDGKPNPNSVYVVGFSSKDLPGFQPQPSGH